MNGNEIRLFISWKPDHVDARMLYLAAQNQPDQLRQLAQAMDAQNRVWTSYVVETSLGEMISLIGDGVNRACIPADCLKDLDATRVQAGKILGGTISVGVGLELAEADRALLVALQLRGGDRVCFWDQEEMGPELKELKDQTEGLRKDEAPKAEETPSNKGNAGGGFSGAQGPAPAATQQAPRAEGSEHSQGEVGRAELEGRPKIEGSGTAQNFEDQFAGHADAQEEDDNRKQVSQDRYADSRQKVVQLLQQVKAAAPKLEQLQQAAPDLYAAFVDITQALVMTAKAMVEGEKDSQSDAEADPDQVQKAEKPGGKVLSFPDQKGKVQAEKKAKIQNVLEDALTTMGEDPGFKELAAQRNREALEDEMKAGPAKFRPGQRVLHVDREAYPWTGVVGPHNPPDDDEPPHRLGPSYRRNDIDGPGHYYNVKWWNPQAKQFHEDWVHQDLLHPLVQKAEPELESALLAKVWQDPKTEASMAVFQDAAMEGRGTELGARPIPMPPGVSAKKPTARPRSPQEGTWKNGVYDPTPVPREGWELNPAASQRTAWASRANDRDLQGNYQGTGDEPAAYRGVVSGRRGDVVASEDWGGGFQGGWDQERSQSGGDASAGEQRYWDRVGDAAQNQAFPIPSHDPHTGPDPHDRVWHYSWQYNAPRSAHPHDVDQPATPASWGISSQLQRPKGHPRGVYGSPGDWEGRSEVGPYHPVDPETGLLVNDGTTTQAQSEDPVYLHQRQHLNQFLAGLQGMHKEELGASAQTAPLDKAKLPMPENVPKHNKPHWPIGWEKGDGKVKVQHPEAGTEGYVSVRAGQVLSNDGHTISSRNPEGK